MTAAGIVGAPETFGLSLTASAAGVAMATHGAFTLKNSFVNLMTGKGEDPGTFNGRGDTKDGSKNAEFRKAKDRWGIPRSQQPYGRGTEPEKGTGKPLKLWHFLNSYGEHITIRQDNTRYYPRDNFTQGVHFNAGPTGNKLPSHHYWK